MVQPQSPTNNNQASPDKTPAAAGETGLAPKDMSQLTPVQKIQGEVIKYATKMWDKERAVEFATRVALIARDNPQLRTAIGANADSFLSAYMASVSLGLMPNTPEQLAYIIPYGNAVQFQPGYKGLIRLARRSGEIKTINAELVYDGDYFKVRFGSERTIEHDPEFEVDRTDYSKVTHAYAIAKLTNGEDVFTVMTRKEIDKIQNSSKAKSTDSPWQTWPERMARKTVLKRLIGDLPTSAEDLQKAVALDSLSEAGKLQFKDGEFIEGQVVDDDTKAKERRARIAAATAKHKEQNDKNHTPRAVKTDGPQ